MVFKFKTYEPEDEVYNEELIDLDFMVSCGFWYDGEEIHRNKIQLSLSNGLVFILCMTIEEFEKCLKKNKIQVKHHFMFSKS